MWEVSATTGWNGLDFSKIVLAVGGLGTGAYGVVDATKAFGGGISNRGFGDIRKVITGLIAASNTPDEAALGHASVINTLRANWLNGMAMVDQKLVAKALIKLNLTRESAPKMAAAIGVDANTLQGIADKLGTAQALNTAETDVYGRFDLLLNALLDQAYQRADQRYRNSAKLLAIPIAVLLAVAGAWAIYGNNLATADLWKAIIAGLLATPLAPVAKDVASTIQAGAKLAQSWKRLP